MTGQTRRTVQRSRSLLTSHPLRWRAGQYRRRNDGFSSLLQLEVFRQDEDHLCWTNLRFSNEIRAFSNGSFVRFFARGMMMNWIEGWRSILVSLFLYLVEMNSNRNQLLIQSMIPTEFHY